MAEYLWTFNIGRLRIGWLKYYYAYVLQREPGLYLQIGKLSFCITSKRK